MRSTTRLLAATATAIGLIAASAAHAATEITVWHAYSPDIKLGRTLERYAETFNARQDDYEVVLTYKGTYDDTINATIAAVRAGKAPALAQIHVPGAPTVIYSDAVKPVGEIMAEAGFEADWGTYIQPVIQMYAQGESQVGFPFAASTPLLWYNADAFAAAGVEGVPATWQELRAAAEKLKADDWQCPVTSSWQGWVLVKNYSFVENQPFANAGNGMDGVATELLLDEGDLADHLARIKGWIDDGLFEYQGRQWTGAHEAFYAERCAVMLESSAGYGGISENADFTFGAGMLPVNADDTPPRNSFIGGNAFFAMAGQSDDVYAGVAAFLSFLAEPENQFDWHRTSGYVPITQGAYELARKEGYYEEFPHQELAIEQLTRGTPTTWTRGLRLGYLPQIDAVINEELENIWSGDKPAEDAVAAMVRRGTPLLERFAKTVDGQ
jgi:sn-glycerol 3-phosphate transport system substrate-binding protein